MEGPKQRKRKNDRIDAHRLPRMGRVDPQSLFPIEHRSAEVRQDLVMLRARDALVAASYCYVYHHGDTTWQRLPKHMSRITVQRDWHRYCTAPEREFPVPITPQIVVHRRADESVAVLRSTFELFVGTGRKLELGTNVSQN
jgi:hypothetical protein